MGSIPNLSIIRGPTRPLKPNSIHRLFEAVAQKVDDTALIFEDRKTSYKELNEKSNKIARAIIRSVKAENLPSNNDGDYIVAVSMVPSDNLVAVLLGIWKSGAAYLPIDPSFPGPRIEHICREAKPFLIVYENDSDYFVNPKKISYNNLIERGEILSGDNLKCQDCLRHARDDLAIVLYTSGSTGIPKGVRLPHNIILNRLYWQFKTFPYSQSEKVGVFKTALTFVDSVSEIWGPLINGMSILVVKKTITQDPEKLVTLLDKYKIERLVLVPSLLRSLLMYLKSQKKHGALKHLRLWICSGETLVVSLAKEFYHHFPENEHKLLNFYGSTEIMGDVTFHIIEGLKQLEHQEKVPIGLPLDNTIIYLLDSNYRPVKAGDVGEIFVSGLNLASGYVNGRDPEKFIENPLAIDPTFARLYRTGDFGKIEKGTILYDGRTDSQVKIRGHRVDLAEVEKAVNSLDEIEKGVVLCYKPGEINQALLAFVTSNALVSENQIEESLRKKLASYMIPQVIILDVIPLLVNGKVDRQALLKSYETVNNNDDTCFQVDINFEGVPTDKIDEAKALFETVANVLNRSARSAISVNANFYEIGGNSLNSIFTITALTEKGYHISIGDFIAAMDFGEILERMTKTHETSVNIKPPNYTMENLKDEHKSAVIDMITTSFYQKADLEQWLMPDLSTMDYTELINAMWEPLLEKNLSFVAKNENGKCEGVALNFDARDEPEVNITSKLTVVFEFLEFIEGPIRDNNLPPGKGKILHSFMMGTHSSLTPKENVAIMHYMEEEVLKMAKDRHFAGILTSNTNPLTQQLGSDVYGYQTLLDYQVNDYVAGDNTKPFGMAPDDQRVKVQWKPI
ncbi:beta-alanyl-bioamine nonribosomal peptide synthetase ebony [Onthophagus taurus]|uniref:beta-alanyl-bioamine nonribosomal peptide synthetase ebony n=1 Tax=Onthophagus taurus TaxID=166361 RepID=UPI000C20EFFB|nr:uncharacterized protein LOC111422609 [Onthophagus taurus]